MWTGVVVLGVAVVIALAIAGYRRRRDGRFRTGAGDRAVSADRLDSGELGVRLGRRATVVQFSSSLCAPCRVAERVITEAVGSLDDVRYVDIDAETQLDLVRRLNILRTPTVVITDRDGLVVTRTAGVPTKAALLSAIPAGDPR